MVSTFGVIAASCIALLGCGASAEGVAAQPAPKVPVASVIHPVTEEDKNYIAAAGSYLNGVNTTSLEVAHTMVAVGNGSFTLSDLHKVILLAKSSEDAGYDKYLDKTNGVVIPGRFSKARKELDQAHRLFQAAMKEYLGYWNDSNDAHIVSAQAIFKRSALMTNSAIDDMNLAMKNLTK
jgi:hypothetical protein